MAKYKHLTKAQLLHLFRENRELFAQLLIDLPDEEFLALLRNVFGQKIPDPLEIAYARNHYFLGTATSLKAEKQTNSSEWEPWEIAAVGYIDRDVYPEAQGEGPDWGFCQFGQCATCKIGIRSNVKHALCPICGGKVYLT